MRVTTHNDSFLNSGGVINASFQIVGTWPWCSEAWKIKVRAGVNSWCNSFRKRPDMLSGPVAMCKMLIIKRGQAKKTKDWDPYKSIKKKCQIECRKAYNNYVSTMLNNDIKSSPKGSVG
jgi:hypothetical protein